MITRTIATASILLASVMLAGCLVTEASGPQTVAVTVETTLDNLHGLIYDHELRATVAVGGGTYSDVPQIKGHYPDLYVAVISETGIYAQEDGAELTSECDDLLKCEVIVDVPPGYYMLAVLDLDVTAIDKHDYVDGLIFTDRARGAIDDARVAAVEEQARAWMADKVEDVPKRAFTVVRRRDCRREMCPSDGLSGTASFVIAPIAAVPVAEPATPDPDAGEPPVK